MEKRLSHLVDLNLLELFIAVHKTRNLTVAGRQLGLSQPAMSRSLSRLRDAYGDQLFVRLPKGMMPTPLADALFASLNSALEIVRQTLEKSHFDPLVAQRVFRIAMSDTSEQILVPTLAKHLADVAPNVRLETVQPRSEALAPSLASGDIDLAVGYYQFQPEHIYRQLLFNAKYGCVVRRDHPGIRGRTLTLENYREFGHVVTTFPSTAHGAALQQILESDAVGAHIALRVGHFLSIGTIIAETDYIATIPGNLGRLFERAFNVKLYEPPLALPVYDVSQFWHARFHQEAGLVWLRQVIKALFSRPAMSA